MGSLLKNISQPREIQQLSLEQLRELAEECRQRIIEVTSKRGGHLASSLGAVEIAVALFKLFDFDRDRLVWDVGHQAYAHKILTGRSESFETLAQKGGIKKFLSRDESPYDHFGAGHASTSISAGVGMAFGRDLQDQDNHVIAVIGDGSMTGGLAFEALNHNGFADKKMLLIYSDNGMSIDPNVGALSRFVTRVTASKLYNRFRDDTWNLIGKAPFSKTLQLGMEKVLDSMKTFFTPGMLFEQLGWRYFGPVDGHNLEELLDVLSHVKDMDGPVVVHAITKKGKGYKYAEEDAYKYHGVKPFVPESGEFLTKSKAPSKKTVSYSDVFGGKLEDLMEQDRKVVAISAAMLSGTGLLKLQSRFPERVVDVGIAEGHAVTCAAGMATTGLKPFVAIYSSFLQRALDHIIHDVAIQHLPVRFMLDRAGLVGADGPTHHGAYDLTYLRMIPEVTIMVPRNGAETRKMIDFAHRHESGPIALRYPRGETDELDEALVPDIELGKAHVLRDGQEVSLFAVGVMVPIALQVAEALEREGWSCAVINARFVKPLDVETLLQYAQSTTLLATLEENTVQGGFGSAVLEALSREQVVVEALNFGIPDRFIAQGTPEEQREDAGISPERILDSLRGRLQSQRPRRLRTVTNARKKAS
jgi:1-deoxy-D-xylulose-5-phosphate synthase